MTDPNPDKAGIRASLESDDFLLEFDTVDSEFHRGFQCGEIWACLVDAVSEVQAIISASNAEMILRMTEATGYTFEGRYLSAEECLSLDLGSGEWMAVLMRLPNA
jgi:hypothetical protein